MEVKLAADTIIPDQKGEILILKRQITPEKGKLTLPGGHLEENETIEQTCVREVKEETGLDIEINKLLEVYSDPERDPRGRSVSVAFVAKPVKDTTPLKDNFEAEEIEWMKPRELEKEEMGFDHWKMIQDYLEKH